MGEIKSVKVDNWGVFFLQKLQNFFNKTDYCDLTLQFRDNSQLKVHRLVLSACTDYFNVLEQTCEVIDDALLMPDELQADVVVPIVNFMYTGTLEFELKMYGKLLRTAKEMNMTVLLKLLEAHRRTMESVNRSQRPPSPKPARRRILAAAGSTAQQQQPQAISQQRRILAAANVSPQQGARGGQTKGIATNAPQQQQMQYRQQIGATSLLRTSGGSPVKTQHGATTVFNRQTQLLQFKTEPEEYETSPVKQQATSPFEQLRKGYNNNKRPATSSFVSPPAKKPNIEDVKEFAEQQRMRKQIAAEYGDDPEYEGMLDDDIHNDDDDDEAGAAAASSSGTAAVAVQATTSTAATTTKLVQHGTTTITFKHESNDKPPTIVVKDSSNSNINHTKIITEVLRQYPHLVKNNKNIKLKIMPNVGGQTQKIIVKREAADSVPSTESAAGQTQQVVTKPPTDTAHTILKLPSIPQQPVHAAKSLALKPIATTAVAAAVAVSGAGVAGAQKRRIDSKTMHSLIALGAENTTGPWLCLRCGVNGRPISIPSYRGFRRHLINTHKETIDTALCEHCGWRSSNNRELHFHMQVEHKVKTTLYTFPECLMCAELFLDTNALNQHMMDSHPDENKQQCIYCNKIFAKELQLYTHMKTYHKKQALEDGIIDYSDEEFFGSHDEAESEMAKKDIKVKILSDISLPNTNSLLKLEPSSEAAALSTVASGIATSIGIASGGGVEDFIQTTVSETAIAEPKFVNADGNEMLLTDEQRKEIMSQLNQEHDGGGVVMVLNEPHFTAEEANIESSTSAPINDGDEAAPSTGLAGDDEHGDEENEGNNPSEEEAQAITEPAVPEEEFEDSQIYRELTSQAEEVKKPTSAGACVVEESKEAVDSLEWAENLISAHDLADETGEESNKGAVPVPSAEEKAKKEDDISKKLKELTGDWSDDENDEDMVEEATTIAAPAAVDVADMVETKSDETKVEVSKSEETKSEEQDVQEQQDSAETEEKTEECKKVTDNAEEIKDTGDAIDEAMRSLHKDDEEINSDLDMHNNDGETDTSAATATIEKTAELDEPEEEIESKQELPKNAGVKIDEDIVVNEAKEDVETQKETATITEENQPEGSKANESNDSKGLLDEIIAAAEADMDDEEEFITVGKDAEVVESASKKIETKEKQTEDIVEHVLESAAAAAEPMETDAEAVATDVDADATADADVTPSTTDAISNEMEVDKDDTVATTAAEATKTEDKVKSLISEWVDEDDNGEVETAAEGEI